MGYKPASFRRGDEFRKVLPSSERQPLVEYWEQRHDLELAIAGWANKILESVEELERLVEQRKQGFKERGIVSNGDELARSEVIVGQSEDWLEFTPLKQVLAAYTKYSSTNVAIDNVLSRAADPDQIAEIVGSDLESLKKQRRKYPY